MFTRLITLAISMCVLIGCNSEHEYRPLSYYRIDTTALHQGDTIQVLYSAGGPNDNSERKFFYHLIVVNVNQPEDTVNLFVPDISSLTDAHDIKIFEPQNGLAYRIMNSGKEIEDLPDNVDALEKMNLTSPDKVLINSKYERANENTYPAIIGMLAEYVAN